MSDEDFFGVLKNRYDFSEKEISLLKMEWNSFCPAVKEIMKSLYTKTYTTLYDDWKMVDGIIKCYTFSMRVENII